MLIRDDDEIWVAITQPAHAHLAGEVARLWADPKSPDVLLGIEQHDIAWMQWDREPPLHAAKGRAAAFLEADPARRLAIWDRVGRLLEAQNPYAAVLVSLHGTNIHTRFGEPGPEVQPLLAGLREEQDALLARIPGAARDRAERDADLLFALDSLSLTLCHGWPSRDLPPVDGSAIRVEQLGDGVASLDPWPLGVAEAELTVPVRRLAERFDDERALHAALAATPYERLVLRLVPA
jgi:hypothetical protein